MSSIFRTFRRGEDGAVTSDFVVLTALVMGLVALFVLPFLSGVFTWGDGLSELTPEFFMR